MSVGIVVVSHSRPLADAAVALAVDMVRGDEPGIAIAAGTADGRLGTDAAMVADAIASVSSGDGVLVLLDLGSAVLSAELALELLPSRTYPVRISAAPLVEGLVAAVVGSAGGAGLAAVAAEAEAALAAKRTHLAAPASAPPPAGSGPDDVVGEVTLGNEVGLHARPAADVVRLVGRFDADVRLQNLTDGRGPVSAASLTGILSLDAGRGVRLRIIASGSQAAEALAALRAAAEDGFRGV